MATKILTPAHRSSISAGLMRHAQTLKLGRGELEEARKTGNCDTNDGRKVICLVCGAKRWGLGDANPDRPGHLRRYHEMTKEQYVAYCEGQGWGTPQVTSLKVRNRSKQWRTDNPERVKANNEAHRHDDQKNLTEADRAQRVQCQLCGRWYRSLLTWHLPEVHAISKRRYLRQFPNAPLMAVDLLDQWSKVAKLGHKKLLKPKPRGRRKGWLSPDTDARVTVIAACKLLEINEYQIAPHAYPLHRRQSDAWKALEKFLQRHGGDIAEKQIELSNLPESERKAALRMAESTLRS